MAIQPPPPMVCSFVVCREIFQDNQTGDYILIGPTEGFSVPEFPFSIGFKVYGHLCGIHREYWPELRLIDSEGEIVWDYRAPVPMRADDPLKHQRLRLSSGAVHIRHPGRYDLLMMAHRIEIVRYPLRLDLHNPPDRELDGSK
jgi:hypothetical protein